MASRSTRLTCLSIRRGSSIVDCRLSIVDADTKTRLDWTVIPLARLGINGPLFSNVCLETELRCSVLKQLKRCSAPGLPCFLAYELVADRVAY